MLYKYSLPHILAEYKQNEDAITRYLKNKNKDSYEGSKSDVFIMGMSIGFFIVVFMVLMALYVWAIVVLVYNWNSMPQWSAYLSVFGLITGIGGPILAIILVYTTRDTTKAFIK